MTSDTGRAESDAGPLGKVLNGIERAGNKLPDPFMLFIYLFVALAVISTALAAAGVSVTVPGEDQPLPVRSALSGEGLQWLLENLVSNFVGFPPLGTVLVILLGVGLAERAGLLESLIRVAFASAPRWALPYAVALVGMSANVASDASFVVVPPLAALVFRAAGRHPVAGLLCAFAAVGAGYSSSLSVTSADALLAGITTQAADTIPAASDITVTAVDNYFFNAVSALILPFVVGFLTARVVEPRLGAYTPAGGDADENESHEVSPAGRRGLRWAGIAVAGYVALIVAGALVPGSPLLGEGGTVIPSPLLSGVVPIVFGFFLVAALGYGIAASTITRPADVPRYMADAVRELSGYIVLIFAAAQFLELFEWTHLGALIAVRGAGLLEGIGLTGYPAILGFIVLASCINLFIISGSAMWSLLAPVFVPLFFLLGYEPAFIQAAFRIGDSATQIITPMNPYLLVLLGFARRYDPDVGLGTLISRLIVYVIPFWVVWVLVLTGFVLLGVPIGPGIGMHHG